MFNCHGSDDRRLALKVLTFNIHNGINWYGTYDLEQITAFIGALKPDLAGIQEISRFWSDKTNNQDMVKLMAEELKMYPSFSAALRKEGACFGNLILSKYPIISTWTKVLSGNREPRNYVAVQVLVSGVRVNFLTTHLGLSISERQEQATGIIGFCKELGNPLIITGDFNEDPNGSAVSLIKGSWPKLNFNPGNGTLRINQQKIGPEIDMVFASTDFVCKSLDVCENFLSDHLPVIANLELKTSWFQLMGQPAYRMYF